MSLLVGLILTALNGPVGTESRGVAVFTHRDIAPLFKKRPKICAHCRVSAAKMYLYHSSKKAKARPHLSL